jgi:DNA-directed RNA polymerase specialized sigma24 family protein
MPSRADLARLAADSQQPQASRNAAILELRPFLLQTARRVLARRALWDSALADDLVSLVELRIQESKFEEGKGSFEGWCFTVMRNDLQDRLKKAAHQRPTVPEVADEASERDRALLEQAHDSRALLSVADLERIRGWPNPLRRVLVLCRGLVWRKVPEQQWQAWLGDCGLSPPFPPDDFDELPAGERYEILAASLGLQMNTLHAHWKRGRPDLLGLDFVRGLAHDD